MTNLRLVLATAALALALGGLNWQFGRLLHEEVRTSTETANQTFTRVFVNDHWDRLRPMLNLGAHGGEPRTNPRLREIDAIVRGFARGTDLAKVKIYDARGVTVYSSDASQIGEDKSRNDGFLGAARGRTVSELTHRGKFGGFDGEVYRRDLVSSYVPVRGAAGVEAVVEVYTDRTWAVEALRERQLDLALWLAPIVLAGPAIVFWLAQGARHLRAADRAGIEAMRRRAELAESQLRDSTSCREDFLRSVAAQFGPTAEALALALTPAPNGPTPASALEQAREGAETLRRHALWVELLAQLESGSFARQTAPFDPIDVLRRSVERVTAMARDKGVTLQVHAAPGVGVRVEGAGESLATALEALLTDSIDLTEAGFVRLKAALQSGELLLDVIDSGIARPAAVIDALAASAATDGEGPAGAPAGQRIPPSAGVRLALAAGLVAAIGGSLHVGASPDSGNWVSIRLPVTPAPDDGTPGRAAGGGEA